MNGWAHVGFDAARVLFNLICDICRYDILSIHCIPSYHSRLTAVCTLFDGKLYTTSVLWMCASLDALACISSVYTTSCHSDRLTLNLSLTHTKHLWSTTRLILYSVFGEIQRQQSTRGTSNCLLFQFIKSKDERERKYTHEKRRARRKREEYSNYVLCGERRNW